jgi:hypothetical protein
MNNMHNNNNNNNIDKNNIKKYIYDLQQQINNTCNNNTKNITNIKENLDELDNYTECDESIKLQIEDLHDKYNKLLIKTKINEKKITTDIKNLYELIKSPGISTSDYQYNGLNNGLNNKPIINSNSRLFIYEDTSQIHKLYIDHDKQYSYAFITMTGGGGAGGVGFIDGLFYYSGGGGGGAASIINKPVKIYQGCVFKIKVGAGGSQSHNRHGSSSCITVIYPDCTRIKITAMGGCNACPTLAHETVTCGGCGGISDLTEINNGNDGAPGVLSIPSQMCACGADGGSSSLYEGGAGGGSYFMIGGRAGNQKSLIGCDGKYGSGGGGSAPRMVFNKKLSGNGGDGIIIINLV